MPHHKAQAHDEVTTQAFPGAVVGKCSPKFTGHYNLAASTENNPELRYCTPARAMKSSRDNVRMFYQYYIIRTADQ